MKYMMPIFLLMTAAFFAGWLVASKRYEALCNQFIVDNCKEKIGDFVNFNIGNYTFKH